MYEFKDEYKTGIKKLDDQHKVLFDIADRTYNLLVNDLIVDKYDKIVELINELRDYTVFHFTEEEGYMESIKYKRLFSQKIEHNEFIKKIESIDFTKIDEEQNEYIRQILEFLINWLTHHICNIDKLIGK
ncbi:hemerythrin family protein [Clostridium sp. BJN0001]|uniref:bacteriohemerythrin n=1 Tax=Clostridium sp. BJN0001 TaxID=2930219 RepID=UPI001FD5A057|nr:hemerythrin family protein [Clostridium sp. BJN0001]